MITEQFGFDSISADVNKSVGKFVENPNLRLGDADSGHGVVFGELEGYGEVAIKPHMKHQRAQMEARNLEHAAEVGIEAIEPIEVAVGGLASYLVTRYHSDLSHLGQTDWAVSAESPKLHSVVNPTLKFGAQVIADRHIHGAVNLDSQARNIVADANGDPLLVDAEKLVFHQDPAMVARLADKDVTAFGNSVLHRGLLEERSPSYRVGHLSENVLDPYLDQLPEDLYQTSPDERTANIQQGWNQFIQYKK